MVALSRIAILILLYANFAEGNLKKNFYVTSPDVIDFTFLKGFYSGAVSIYTGQKFGPFMIESYTNGRVVRKYDSINKFFHEESFQSPRRVIAIDGTSGSPSRCFIDGNKVKCDRSGENWDSLDKFLQSISHPKDLRLSLGNVCVLDDKHWRCSTTCRDESHFFPCENSQAINSLATEQTLDIAIKNNYGCAIVKSQFGDREVECAGIVPNKKLAMFLSKNKPRYFFQPSNTLSEICVADSTPHGFTCEGNIAENIPENVRNWLSTHKIKDLSHGYHISAEERTFIHCAIGGSSIICWGDAKGTTYLKTIPTTIIDSPKLILNPKRIFVGSERDICVLDDLGFRCGLLPVSQLHPLNSEVFGGWNRNPLVPSKNVMVYEDDDKPGKFVCSDKDDFYSIPDMHGKEIFPISQIKKCSKLEVTNIFPDLSGVLVPQNYLLGSSNIWWQTLNQLGSLNEISVIDTSGKNYVLDKISPASPYILSSNGDAVIVLENKKYEGWGPEECSSGYHCPRWLVFQSEVSYRQLSSDHKSFSGKKTVLFNLPNIYAINLSEDGASLEFEASDTVALNSNVQTSDYCNVGRYRGRYNFKTGEVTTKTSLPNDPLGCKIIKPDQEIAPFVGAWKSDTALVTYPNGQKYEMKSAKFELMIENGNVTIKASVCESSNGICSWNGIVSNFTGKVDAHQQIILKCNQSGIGHKWKTAGWVNGKTLQIQYPNKNLSCESSGKTIEVNLRDDNKLDLKMDGYFSGQQRVGTSVLSK